MIAIQRDGQQLFEIQDQKRFGINVYGVSRQPDFLQAASLYHPDTVTRSLEHDGSGTEPGIKDPDGNWDLRPHAGRIVHVTNDTLRSWHAVLETDDVPIAQTRMVYAVNKATAAVLDKLAAAPRIGDLGLLFSPGWHEKNDRTKGFFDSEWGVPESWDSVILQGPHLYVATPLYKTPNETMLNHLDWTETDFEVLAPDAIPATSYKPRGDRAQYGDRYPRWSLRDGTTVSARADFRVAWRRMAANTGERTLIPAIIPPDAAHLNPVYSAGFSPRRHNDLLVVAGVLGSLLSDFSVRSAARNDIINSTIMRLACPPSSAYFPLLRLRVLRLNAITRAYAPLWAIAFDAQFYADRWTIADDRLSTAIEHIEPGWTPNAPLRRAIDRRQAAIEIDALVALMLGITDEELITIYRTQFPVLYGYDRRTDFFDAAGRLVPNSVLSTWRRKGSGASAEELTAVHPSSRVAYTFKPPFDVIDREFRIRAAYFDFSKRMDALAGST
ncbi:MAG: restriction endonuclease [Mycobacterium sp.]|nr:MAG: restriction endonuclease [Mycobacterium sp.]